MTRDYISGGVRLHDEDLGIEQYQQNTADLEIGKGAKLEDLRKRPVLPDGGEHLVDRRGHASGIEPYAFAESEHRIVVRKPLSVHGELVLLPHGLEKVLL